MQIQSLVPLINLGISQLLAGGESRAPRSLDGGRVTGSRGATEGAESSGVRFDTRDTFELSPEGRRYVTGQLSEEQQRQVQQLRQRDREVRAHEQAHLTAAGPYARGGPSFQYVQGPDGRQYAVGGEVSIDTSPIPDDPEATIRKAQVVRAAASAPAQPSAQDRKVAAAAAKMEAQARQELREKERTEQGAETDGEESAAGDNKFKLQDATGGDTFTLGFRFDAVA